MPGYLQPFYDLFLADHTMRRDRVVVTIFPFKDAMPAIPVSHRSLVALKNRKGEGRECVCLCVCRAKGKTPSIVVCHVHNLSALDANVFSYPQ